jgi:hypothetical protein
MIARESMPLVLTDNRGVQYVPNARSLYGNLPDGWRLCHSCGTAWNDDLSTGVTPAPSGRCPFEYEHDTILTNCGHAVTPGRYTTGVAWIDGYALCYGCADSWQADEMTRAETMCLYVTGEGHLSTWTGGILAQGLPNTHGVSRSGWNGSEIHSWRFRDTQGAIWYGRNGGHGMAIRVRRAKAGVR